MLVIYIALVDGFYKEGELDEASKLFYEMTTKTYALILSRTVQLLMVYVRKAS